MSEPLVTIITVTYNAGHLIQSTIASVLGQSYPNIEYLIIDGASTDNTLTIIKEQAALSNGRLKFISEKDQGIYFAMNKGIDLASGTWINFLHAGDCFYDRNVLSQVFSRDYDVDLLYGDSWQRRAGTLIFCPSSSDLERLWKRPSFGHESLFVNKDILKKFKFDTKYQVAADADFIYKCYRQGCRFQKLSQSIVIVDSPGYSQKHWWRSGQEAWQIATTYDHHFRVKIFHLLSVSRSVILVFLRKILIIKLYKFLKKLFTK
jgi:glycosyltransferase involved in cell wall biosynthesis